MMSMILPLVLGCAMGPSAETLVDELRVLAVLADAPEAGPGQTVAFESLVVDPKERGFDVMTWSCTWLGEGCLEDLDGSGWAGVSVSSLPSEPWFSSTYAVPAVVGPVLSADPIPLVQHWTLACEPGRCPVLEEVLAADGGSLSSDVRAWLSAPETFMEDLPMMGVSLAFRSLYLSSRPESERRTNPSVSCEAEQPTDNGSLSVEAEGRLEMRCAVSGVFDGDAAVWGYTTAGGWEGESQEIDQGDEDVAYVYIAPQEPAAEPIPLWVVIIDGFGGVGLWSGEVAVQKAAD